MNRDPRPPISGLQLALVLVLVGAAIILFAAALPEVAVRLVKP